MKMATILLFRRYEHHPCLNQLLLSLNITVVLCIYNLTSTAIIACRIVNQNFSKIGF